MITRDKVTAGIHEIEGVWTDLSTGLTYKQDFYMEVLEPEYYALLGLNGVIEPPVTSGKPEDHSDPVTTSASQSSPDQSTGSADSSGGSGSVG